MAVAKNSAHLPGGKIQYLTAVIGIQVSSRCFGDQDVTKIFAIADEVLLGFL
jgi:hypothetical protein